MTYTKHPESLRLADWLDDQYDQDHHKADAAAELRRLHAIETALQQGYDAARLEIESLRDEVKEYRHGAGVQKALIESLLADKPEDALDAARYRMLRRGQHWSVINGVGDTLRAEELDAAIDAARSKAKIREDVASIRRLASGDQDARQIYDKLADDRLVRHAANAMQEKLQLARVKGRGGWWNSDECTIEHLRTLLREHVEKGDMRDVLNLAAMVYVREIADMRPNA